MPRKWRESCRIYNIFVRFDFSACKAIRSHVHFMRCALYILHCANTNAMKMFENACDEEKKHTHTLTFLSVVIWWSELGFCSNRKLIRLRAHLLKSLYALVNILQVLVHCCKVQLHFAIFMSNAAVFFLSSFSLSCFRSIHLCTSHVYVKNWNV